MQLGSLILTMSIIAMMTSCSDINEPCCSGDVNLQTCVTKVPRIELGEELLSAIKGVDIVSVNVCLLAGADVNYKDDNGITPLGAAISDIEKGPNPKIVELLLKKGADPKALWGNCGTTPFFYLVQLSTSSRAGSAVLSNQVATVRLLLKHGADPNKRQGLFRKTSLEYAAMCNGDIELIKALVEGGAETTDEMIVNVENTEVKRYLQGIKKKECQKVSFGEKGKDELLH